VTPEIISQHISNFCNNKSIELNKPLDVILDCFSGCGGNSFPLVKICNHVVAIDNNIDKKTQIM
jgi:hypothetical protein